MILRLALAMVLTLSLSQPASAKTFAEIFGARAYDDAQWQSFVEQLDYRQGRVALQQARITLNIPNGFYFLAHDDSQRVLAAWGNPTTAKSRSLGMLFPANTTPIDPDVWAAELLYDEAGYVADDKVGVIDPSALLAAIRSASQPDSALSDSEGYGPIEVVGWAAPPFYDKANHRLYLAKALRFGEAGAHTLNYTIYGLGRHGVLSINFIAEMAHLPSINAAIPAIASIAAFDKGAAYDEFLPYRDKYAPYALDALMIGQTSRLPGNNTKPRGNYALWLGLIAGVLCIGGMLTLKILRDPDV